MDVSPAAESFRDLLLRHRGRTGLTQRELAARMGAGRRTVQDWEAGVNHPGAELLQPLIQTLLEGGGLTVGREAAEAQEIWSAVLREAPRMHTPFDNVWFARLLTATTASRPASDVAHDGIPAAHTLDGFEIRSLDERRQDWGDAPDVLGFVGRDDELATVGEWVLRERCRLVAVLGMGGIGKTSFSSKLAQDVAPAFQGVYWRSLRNAPPRSDWLAEAIGFLSNQQLAPPVGEAKQLTAVLQLLRERRCLLVLDNFETLLEPGQREGRYRDGFGGYGALLRAIGETAHQSCLLLTSREAPPELIVLGGHAVRTLALGGLGVPECRALLADKQLAGNSEEWSNLIALYGGNGLALKLVAESIRRVFAGHIGAFLEQSGSVTVFGGIRRLLAEQLDRSSAVEQHLLGALAVEREPVTIAELVAELGPHVGRGTVLEAIEALRRRSLAERVDTGGLVAFTLQSAVLEYVTDRLVEHVADEIGRGQPAVLVRQPLIKAQAKDYIRQTQERLIGEPILQQVKSQQGQEATEQRLISLLDGWRGQPTTDPGYGPGNGVNLLRLLRGNLRGLDMSRLAIQQAYLAQVDAQDATLAHTHLANSVLAEAFELTGYVTMTADGALLAAGTTTGELWLWRVADRRPLWMAQGHTGPVYGVAMPAQLPLVASGGGDRTVRIWEADTGRPIGVLEGHLGAVRCVAFSADGQLVASGSADGTVRLWDPSSGQPVANLQGHTGGVWGVAMSADGGLLASSGGDGTVRLWQTSTGLLVATLEGHIGAVWGVALSGDGRLVASAGGDGTVRLWETKSARPGVSIKAHAGAVLGVALTTDGKLLVSCNGDGTVRLWHTTTGQPLATLRGHTGSVFSVALPAHGQLMASGSSDGTVRLWAGAPAAEWRQVATLQGNNSSVRGLALSADGQLLATGGADGTVRLWEGSSGRPRATLDGHNGGIVWDVALSADGELVASAGSDETVRLWQSSVTGAPQATLLGHKGAVYCVALSADGQLVASGGTDGTIRLWESSTGWPRAMLHGHTGAVYSVALSSEGNLLASGGTDGKVRLWDASTGQPLVSLQGHTSTVWRVALSTDGGLLMSSGEDATVRLWDPSTGLPLTTLLGHAGTVYSLALSADGRVLASGGADGTVRLWDVNRGEQRATLQGHTGVVRDLAMSADGQLIASASFDGTVKLWDANTGACLRTLRAARLYERLDITGLTGITDGQRAALLALGAIEQNSGEEGQRIDYGRARTS